MNKNINFVPDKNFIRNEIPMTKEQVRILTISYLDITPDNKVLDIGAGTGSLSIEAARRAYNGIVTSIDKEKSACRIIEKNIEKFNIKNINLIHGQAPLDSIYPEFYNRIIIGGSGSGLNEILEWSNNLLKENGKIICNAVTLETCYKTLFFLENNNYNDIISFQALFSDIITAGKKHMFKAKNPVFIIRGVKNG